MSLSHRPKRTNNARREGQRHGESYATVFPVCALTSRATASNTLNDDEDIFRALRVGARGYLLKDASREEVLESIRLVHAGQTIVPPAIAARLAARVGARELTGRELEVLALLATGKANKEIGQTLCISDTTVKSHVKAIFSKLDALSRTQAVTTTARRGLIGLN